MEKYPFVYKESYPDLEAIFTAFLIQHKHELSNRVIDSFLSNTEYYKLFVDAVCIPTLHHRKKLDEAFQQFFTEIRLIHYISKLISRVSRDCYLKEKKRHSYSLAPFCDISLDTNRPEYEVADKEEEVIDIVVRNTRHLLEHVSNPSLYKALQQLTRRQLDILELHFLHHLTHTEIGQVLGISRQSVAKSYNKAIRTLRLFYKEGECVGAERMD
ncbi:sigma-70 family RNA polymerase sigma factor [Aneurinibacillus thermoaerophilus]|uniref:RNA polymerase sigma factor, sigma-70 family n=1 Tax=Aneurinibacillus thermoaerophilus TaxID=143495 RepID=A0A1G7ZFX1_ANETH|nr:sigma-70 family RNA polymerase sigma factor [Aneurinibacillus thermoaerophilus]MED0676544.1 sigma-70 family RNA polymerase sigma factor [Aneurinibacillus thermoaerophilus]MED0735957.1 sigma-70 family RNA polymerase sigma factor [Aneurinibacillus thermoaerophilus]MED0757087.1 sigma-70 family RNA polymerase sigma factor [Aneurinibacillus thermoaerophilus]MED0759392.1 sigma-70 family RNA polymerase sigma factor [Aneurinibacillus thermoaerophilus]QYY44360.1 sigma-70 family RNA polymerase sigma 